MKFLFVLLITFTNTCVWSQEFVGYKSEDLVMMLEKRFLRNTERSNFIDQYNQENGSYPKEIKNVTINRNEYYTKTLLFEKGYIITKSETSPFEKSLETYTLDAKGNMLKYGRHSTLMDGDSILADETTLILFNYGDTLTEIHNFQNAQGNKKDFMYTYIHDANGNVSKKISKTYNNRTDTTKYQYDGNNQLTQETLSNGTIIRFEYENGRTIQTTKEYPDHKTKGTTKYSYNKKGMLKKAVFKEGETETHINLKYDGGQMVEFTYKTQDGAESVNEKRQISYNTQGHISEDWNGYLYNYQYDTHGNWTRCNIFRDGKQIENISREIVYQ
ncbi:MAG: hypothetical protein WCU80_00065 [Paludibacteraceae bacterium]